MTTNTTNDTNIRVDRADLYRFKAQAAKRRTTMKRLFTLMCTALENGWTYPAWYPDGPDGGAEHKQVRSENE